MSSLLDNRGLEANDLHGSNYTLNSRAVDLIRKDDSYLTLTGEDDRSFSSNLDFFNQLSNRGGLVHIVDAGGFTPRTEPLYQKYKEFSTIKSSKQESPPISKQRSTGNRRRRNQLQIDFFKKTISLFF